MTEDVSPAAADPTALTGALRDAGVLTDGRVVEDTVQGLSAADLAYMMAMHWYHRPPATDGTATV
jgi:hypothetical protein